MTPEAVIPAREAGLHLDTVETPAALIDLERIRRNVHSVSAYTDQHGIAWRPHVKTHKSTTLARLQLEAGARGLTVATPREAEVMATVCDDLLLAHPPVGAKRSRIMRLPPRVRLSVALDSIEVLKGIADAAHVAGRRVGVLVELDMGMGRVGCTEPVEAVRLVDRLRETAGVEYDGVLFYAGHIRSPVDEQANELRTLQARLDRFLDALGSAGHTPRVVSGGSTPTLWNSHAVRGLNEIRAGTCVFHDRDTVALGVCGASDVGYTILASVVSVAVPGQAVVDAGSKALSREEFRGGGAGYGVLLDRPDVRLRALSEEHGILDLTGTSWRPAIGDRVRVVPNHVCVSVNLQDRLLAVGGDGSLGPIPIEARGRLPWRS